MARSRASIDCYSYLQKVSSERVEEQEESVEEEE